jgi:hypothetical protein
VQLTEMLEAVVPQGGRPRLAQGEAAGDGWCPARFLTEKDCPGLSQQGRHIPVIKGMIRRGSIEPKDARASLLQVVNGAAYYHLPFCYLP